MYMHMFGALLAKKVASKTSDSRATTPSATNMEDYMESSPITTQALLTPLKEETWDGGIPPPQHVPGNVTVINPVVEDTLVHINAPRQTNETDETYHRRRAVVIRHGSRMAPEEVDDRVNKTTTTSRKSTRRQTENTGIRMPPRGRIPLVDNHMDRIVYQRIRNEDLARSGASAYDDQGIAFKGHQPVDIME
jgi:hypothetical protein